MSLKRVGVWMCVLGLLGTGCTAAREAATPVPSGAPAPSSPVPVAAPAPSTPACPESIAGDAPLEADYGPRIQARRWLPALAPSEFAFVPTNTVEESFRQRLELAEGTVELLALEERSRPVTDGGAALVMARPVAGGFCIINTWATWQSTEVDVSLAGSWESPDKRMAILLLKLELARAAGGEETRWVVLGTDGDRAWIALGQPPAHQLIAPSVSLSPKKDQLYLDVKIKYVNRLRLGPDGHFVQAANKR
jgi:hypothetical protein